MSDPGPFQSQGDSASEPTTKSGSTAKDATASTTASPYGTRSRNRGGNSRPNYAEDKDMDMEIFDQLHPQKRDDDSKKTSRQVVSSSVVNTDDQQNTPPPPPPALPTRTTNGLSSSSSTSSRKPLPADNKQSQAAATAKDSASNANPPTGAGSSGSTQTTSSKKRKAATQSSNNQPSAAESTHVPANAKKPSNNNHNGNNAAVSNGVDKGYAATNLLTFENCGARLKDGKLIADDGTILDVNDHVYLVCEPPGEPYYLARIMEFLHAKNDLSQPIDALRVNWYYRPKDIARKVNDTRAVFATMHSDISPLTSLRGKCTIKHKAEIKGKIEEYRKNPDCFWFEKLYDRYIQKNYEVIPTFQIINVPEKVKKVLDERWKYILVEQGRGKELTSAVKTCRRCSGYCASNDSVDCAVCEHTYHMNCVRPPLLKKPSRGFAWSCAACSRAQERKLEARNTPNVGLDSNAEPEEEELLDEEEDDQGADTGRSSPADGTDHMHIPATEEQMYHASLWPYRYLGIHCKVEDALDYDDRIYPRASTRVGPRHQATVLDWPGRPIEFVKPPEIEIKKTGRKDGKLNKEAQAALEAEKIAKAKRPKWILDEPPGYVPRGEDFPIDDPRNTAVPFWIPPEVSEKGKSVSFEDIDKFMDQAKAMALELNLPEHSTNLLDHALQHLYVHDYDAEEALEGLPNIPEDTFDEPNLSSADLKKFEEGIAKFGSELHSVKKHAKTVTYGHIVRFYYTWKKTERGKQIWGNYSGRKSKKEAKEAKKAETASQSKVQDDVADDHDDSAFDADKAVDKKRSFICKFCNTKNSRQWRRAPNASGAVVTEGGGKGANKDKSVQYVVALCRRCAELWRRYAIQWEDVDQLYSKVAQAGGRAWKKKIDEELLKEIVAAEQRSKNTPSSSGATTPPSNTTPAPASNQPAATAQEPARKKQKTTQPQQDKDVEMTGTEPVSAVGTPVTSKKKDKAGLDKEKEKEKEPVKEKKETPAPPPVPELPKPRTMPCDVCRQLEPLGDQHVTCKECRLTVHRNCYGVVDNRNPGKWVCDMCINDRSPHVSIHYKCVLCPVEYTEHDFVEPPKTSHKKKTEKDRERERQEREVAVSAAEYYRKRQEEFNRPVNPREPLKRTADNNWVHATCAVWTPEVKFGIAKALEPSEGITSIPRSRYSEVCEVCKSTRGACINCAHCKASVHVECAHQSEDYVLGFEITPIKGSRRDQHNIVTIGGESGAMSASVWCKQHVPKKTVVHQMYDVVDEAGTNTLSLYVQNFKKADLTLTGCARKANLISTAARMSNPTVTVTTLMNRRASTTTVPATSSAMHIHSLLNGDSPEDPHDLAVPGGKICITCGVDASPRWYPISDTHERELANGHYGCLGTEAKKFAEQRHFQCHKCKKLNRQPKPHVPPPSSESPHVAPSVVNVSGAGLPAPSTAVLTNGADHGPNGVDAALRGTPPLSSPRLPEHDPTPRRHSPYVWQSGLQAPLPTGLVHPPGAIAGPQSIPPPTMQPHPLQAPPIAPPPMARSMSGRSQSGAVQPSGPALPPQAYQTPPPPPPPPSAASGPYGDWHRTTHHGPPMNGGPPLRTPRFSPIIPPLAPPALRPPSLHHSPPHAPHAHLSNGHMVNGVAPGRRMSGPPPPPSRDGSGGYMASYHSPAPYHNAAPHQSNGAIVPPRIDHAFASVLNPPRAYGSGGSVQPPAHMGPAMGRDVPISRDVPPMPQPPPPTRAPEPRPASGASASPSLRNLLS